MDRCVLGEPRDKETDGGKSNTFPEIPQGQGEGGKHFQYK